jgi:hypothetical protein
MCRWTMSGPGKSGEGLRPAAERGSERQREMGLPRYGVKAYPTVSTRRRGSDRGAICRRDQEELGE